MSQIDALMIDAARTAAVQVNTAVAALEARVLEIDSACDILRNEEDTLRNSPVSIDDFRLFIGDYIDSKREAFRENLAAEFNRMLYPNRGTQAMHVRSPITFSEMEKMLDPLGEQSVSQDFLTGGSPHFFVGALGVASVEIGAYFFLHEQMKATILECFDGLGLELRNLKGVKVAESRAAIRIRLAEIESELGQLGAEKMKIDSDIRVLRGKG